MPGDRLHGRRKDQNSGQEENSNKEDTMKKQKKDTRWLAGVAMMTAIVILLANTPLGLIHLPVIKATTIHIPVILGAIVFGPLAGAFLGLVFGICSVISNMMVPSLLSFAFNPFLAPDFAGVLKVLWIAVGCRIMIGVVSGWLWIGLSHLRSSRLHHVSAARFQYVALPLTGFLGSMTNTIFVMGSIYFLFAREYAEARNVGLSAVFGLVMTTVTGSGIPEAIAAAVLVLAIGKALLSFMNRTKVS